jgi:hypothetical protein
MKETNLLVITRVVKIAIILFADDVLNHQNEVSVVEHGVPTFMSEVSCKMKGFCKIRSLYS